MRKKKFSPIKNFQFSPSLNRVNRIGPLSPAGLFVCLFVSLHATLECYVQDYRYSPTKAQCTDRRNVLPSVKLALAGMHTGTAQRSHARFVVDCVIGENWRG